MADSTHIRSLQVQVVHYGQPPTTVRSLQLPDSQTAFNANMNNEIRLVSLFQKTGVWNQVSLVVIRYCVEILRLVTQRTMADAKVAQ